MRLSSFLLVLFLFTSCEEENRTDYLPGNTGNQGEILVLAPASFWQLNDVDYLREGLLKVMPGLPAAEPFFTTLEVKTEGFTDIFKTHRNILEFRIDPTNQTSVLVRKDVFAKQQLQIIVVLNSIRDLGDVVDNRLNQILWEFHHAELNRLISRNRAFGSKVLNAEVADKTGLQITMQQDFEIAKDGHDFLWLRLDREKPVGGYQHQINQGILLYARPYQDTAQFTDSSLLEWKRSINSQYVEGPNGSHMDVSYKLYPPEFRTISFLEQSAKEIRGLWRMEGVKGVFMGGPFYSLSFYNPKDGKQWMVEGYVYGPQFNKRAFVREVEAIAKSVVPL
ncbi:MAG: DUF4837 family protein [Flavobacteriales bacterium]